ncbi:hypothetical protein RRG08_057199 [Elysia crispata]|uniref:Uncharacterized protein n=1 Tax=Elysia crispata TaxID=231223 RepID=A0AAE0XX89_9GAST|nr:hypothetical protein RRG08_057199 [Elysia crispata]
MLNDVSLAFVAKGAGIKGRLMLTGTSAITGELQRRIVPLPSHNIPQGRTVNMAARDGGSAGVKQLRENRAGSDLFK